MSSPRGVVWWEKHNPTTHVEAKTRVMNWQTNAFSKKRQKTSKPSRCTKFCPHECTCVFCSLHEFFTCWESWNHLSVCLSVFLFVCLSVCLSSSFWISQANLGFCLFTAKCSPQTNWLSISFFCCARAQPFILSCFSFWLTFSWEKMHQNVLPPSSVGKFPTTPTSEYITARKKSENIKPQKRHSQKIIHPANSQL